MDVKRKMQEAKEGNEALRCALRLLQYSNPELARIMKELENEKKK